MYHGTLYMIRKESSIGIFVAFQYSNCLPEHHSCILRVHTGSRVILYVCTLRKDGKAKECRSDPLLVVSGRFDAIVQINRHFVRKCNVKNKVT